MVVGHGVGGASVLNAINGVCENPGPVIQGSRPLRNQTRARLAVVYGCENNARDDGTPTGPFVAVQDVIKGVVVYEPDVSSMCAGCVCVCTGCIACMF